MKKIRNFFYDIKRGIKNLFVWFPVIWKDRDWDQQFLYIILHFKLKRMEKMQRYHGMHINREKTADQIKVAVLLLDRIINDVYLENVMTPHEKKWGETEWNFTPWPQNKKLSQVSLTVKNANTPEEKAQESKERMTLYEHSDNLKKQDLDMLFKHIRKYVEGWWD